MLGITSAFGYGYNTAKDYLFPQTPKKNDRENTPLLDLELGEGSYPSLFPPNLPGTVKITSKPIITSEQTKMKTPPNPPGTAAGDPDKFMPRQEFLLKEQFKDIEGRSTTTVGEAIYAILTKSEHVEGKPSIIDEKTASDIGLVSTGKTVISETFKPHTKIGDAYIHLNVARPSADLNVVLGRQEVIKAITEDSSLETKLSTELTKMAPGENYLLSCRDGRKQLPGSVSSLYYKMHPRINDIANNSSLALDISALGTIFKKVTGTVMQGISGVAFSAYALTETARA
ncbi:MAG: hypothetical protein JSS09_00675, partial [Verrucomicrobia bacterium]|nr:hypothetical protein [Verrucomicrobiota bacterium]